MLPPRLALAWLSACGTLAAQGNVVPGLDVRQDNIEFESTSTIVWGRSGAHPNGEVALAYSYHLCNTGSVQVPWEGPYNGYIGTAPGLRPEHPFWSFMLVRESNGRMVQISDDRAFVKHASAAGNSASCGIPCTPSGTTQSLGVGCGDAYGQNTNSNRFWLGPRDEVDPWLGLWNPVGSYFDRGDPDVGLPANSDGIRSLDPTQLGAFDLMKNRLQVKDSDLATPGRFYCFMHTLVMGEHADLRGDNYGHRGFLPTWDPMVPSPGGGLGEWVIANLGSYAYGSPLHAWQGASVEMARNGNDDGHFIIGVHVTGPVGGLYHYEYAVHNLDNRRGAATFRVPLCPSTPVGNIGFRDIDGLPLSDWSASHVGDELVFAAPANNPLHWNAIFNFWFDCPRAPVNGPVALDQAMPGPGAFEVVVGGPGMLVPAGTARVADLGPGCGAPSPTLAASGLPVLGNQNFGLTMTSTPSAQMLLFVSEVQASLPFGPCTQHLGGALVLHGFFLADPTGLATAPMPVPNSLIFDGYPLHWQAAQLVNGGPVLGLLTLSNGLQTIVGCR